MENYKKIPENFKCISFPRCLFTVAISLISAAKKFNSFKNVVFRFLATAFEKLEDKILF